MSRTHESGDTFPQRMNERTSPRWNQARNGVFTIQRSKVDISATAHLPRDPDATIALARSAKMMLR